MSLRSLCLAYSLQRDEMLTGIRDVVLDYDRINSLVTFSTDGNYKLFKFLLLTIKIKTASQNCQTDVELKIEG